MLGGLNILNLGVNLALLKVQLTTCQWIANPPDLPRIRMAPYGLESAVFCPFQGEKGTRDWECLTKETWRVFPKIEVPEIEWFIMENPIKMDDLGVPLFLETPTWIFFLLILLFQQTIRWKKQIRGLFPWQVFDFHDCSWKQMGNSQPFPARWLLRCQFSAQFLSCCFHAKPARYLQCMMSRFRSRCQWNPREKESTTTWELYIQPAIRGLRHGSGTSFFWKTGTTTADDTCAIGSDFSKSFDISHISKITLEESKPEKMMPECQLPILSS